MMDLRKDKTEEKKNLKNKIAITISDDLLDYIEKLTKEKGMNRSATISMIISDYKKQQEAMKAIERVKNLIPDDMFKELIEKQIQKDFPKDKKKEFRK